jgi:AcrR family transcriptional regulator
MSPLSTSGRRKRPYHHGDLRQALLDATLELLADSGLRDLSLRAVARHAGVSHAASYRHFASKESLLAALAEQGFRMLGQAMSAAMQAQADEPVARLQAAGVGYVSFGVQHPQHLQVMFGGAIGSFEHYPQLVEAARAAYALLADVVRNGIERGALRAKDAQTVQAAAWAIVHGLTQLMAGGQLCQSDGAPLPLAQQLALARSVTALFSEGLAAQRPTGRRPTAKTGVS